MSAHAFKSLLFAAVLLPVVLCLVGLGCLRERGFTVDKITSSLPDEARWETTLPDVPELQRICSQKFFYLKSGSQAYAFVSRDGEYVLKFFKMKSLLPKRWLNYIPSSLLEAYRHKKVDQHIHNLELTFGGFKAAYDLFQERSGLLCVHLNKTPLFTEKVAVLDEQGKEFKIDLNQVPFILQKKAELARDRLVKQAQQGKEETIKSVRALLELIASRLKLGLRDYDSGIKCNYGFIGNTPIQIDCGRIVVDPSVKEPEEFLRQMDRIVVRLCHWAHRDYPELGPPIQEEWEKLQRELPP